MAGFIRFAVFALVLVGVLVFVVLPAVASPFLTQMARDMGLRGEDVNVTVDAFDPSLLTGHAERLRIQGQNVDIEPAVVGRMDLVLGGVSFLDRTFESVDGRLEDVTLAYRGVSLRIASVDISGPADGAVTVGRFTAAETERLIGQAASRTGLAVDDVRLVDGGLRVRLGRAEARAGIGVQGGALVLQPDVGPPLLLLQPAPSDPWRLSEAYVSPTGVTVRGIVDAAALTAPALGRGSP